MKQCKKQKSAKINLEQELYQFPTQSPSNCLAEFLRNTNKKQKQY
jgi:hypothetical protein